MTNTNLPSTVRKTIMDHIAEDLVNVQPMDLCGEIFTIKFDSVKLFKIIKDPTDDIVPNGYVVVYTDWKVSAWIEDQPIHMWKPSNKTGSNVGNYYIISEELYTLMVLRWS